MGRRPAGAAAAALVMLAAGSAAGFVRKTSMAGMPLRWPGSCVPMAVYPNGYADMTPDEIAASVGAAAQTWSPERVTCDDGSHPYVAVVVGMMAAGAPAPPVAYDGQNTLVFETGRWSGDDPSQVAVTYSFTQPGGRIVDADMRINAAFFQFANLDPAAPVDSAYPLFDLQNAVTHEMGHLIGLDHTCLLEDVDPRPIDDAGNPVPFCSEASAAIQASTMYPSAVPGEISQRILSADDVRGICAIYPATADPHQCALDLPDDGCGCAASPTRLPSALVLCGAALLLGLSRARPRGAGPRRTPPPG
jgi:hypothetical protein